MSFSNQLIELTDISCRELESIPTIQKLLSGDVSEKHYVSFMTDIYPIVLHFCPIMAVAAGRCAQNYDVVRLYLYDHIHEEKGHEKIVLQDIASFGYTPGQVIEKMPRGSVQAMIAFNYYSALLKNPCSVLGMIYVLEFFSFLYGGRVAKAVALSMGRKADQGFSFLDSHAQLDEDHTTKLKTLFVFLNETHSILLLNSVETNFYLFKNITLKPITQKAYYLL